MHARPPTLLRQLIRTYGPTLAHDPRRVEAFLHDLCGQHVREIFVLVHAQEAKIPVELLAAGALAGDPALWQRLSRRLQDRMALTEEAADWAVKSWAVALNITPLHQRRWQWLPHFGTGQWDWGRIRGPHWDYSGVQWKVPFRLNGRIGWIGTMILVVLALTLLLRASPSLGRTMAFWAQEAASPQAVLSTTVAVDQLESFYPTPREVRIAAAEISVHAEPAVESTVLARLSPLGAAVTIDGYSPAGDWAHIAKPLDGWIEQRLITHTALVMNGAASYPVVIDPGRGRITDAGVRVRQEPTTESLSLGQLEAEEAVTILAVTFDRRWYQILAPMQGWVSGDYVEEASDEGGF